MVQCGPQPNGWGCQLPESAAASIKLMFMTHPALRLGACREKWRGQRTKVVTIFTAEGGFPRRCALLGRWLGKAHQEDMGTVIVPAREVAMRGLNLTEL
jgi:hypothetical protein